MIVRVEFPAAPEGISISADRDDYPSDAEFFTAIDAAVKASYDTAVVAKNARNAATWR